MTLKHERATEAVREQAALYAFGALTQHEAHSFEAHLNDGCSVCESELRRFERAAAGVGLAVEEIETPEYVRDLLLARIEREPHESVSVTPTDSDEESPLPEPAPLFSGLSKPKPKRSMGKPIFWILLALLIVLVGLCAYIAHELRSAKGLNAQLQEKVLGLEADAGNLSILYNAQKEESESLDQLLVLAGKPGVRMARLKGQSDDQEYSGVLYLDPEQHQCVLVGTFPPPPEGKAYQLWFFTSSAKVSAGLITINPGTATFTTVPVPETAVDADTTGITLEPESGSSEPTTNFFVKGRFY